MSKRARDAKKWRRYCRRVTRIALDILRNETRTMRFDQPFGDGF